MKLPPLQELRLGPDSEFGRHVVWSNKKWPVPKFREDVVAQALGELRWEWFYEPIEYQDPGHPNSRRNGRVNFDYLVYLPDQTPIHIEVTTSRDTGWWRKRGQATRVEEHWGILVVLIGPDDLDFIEENPLVLQWLVQMAFLDPPARTRPRTRVHLVA